MRLILVTKRLAALALSALGTALLSFALEQLLDPEQPKDLVARSVVAGIAGIVLFVAGALLVVVTLVTSKRNEKRKTAGMVVKLISIPTGIALSLAVSLVISAFTALMVPHGAIGAVTFIGAILIAVGYFLDRNFWRDLFIALVDAVTSSAGGAGTSTGGTTPLGGGTAPSTGGAGTSTGAS